jgi:hypothetical protein
MATLNDLKQGLKASAPSGEYPLTDAQCSAGFDVLVQGSTAYQDFIIPLLSKILTQYSTAHREEANTPLHNRISLLEIGPGPKSVLADLPIKLKGRIKSYTAFESNELYAAQLEERINMEGSLSGLETACDIRREAFKLHDDTIVLNESLSHSQRWMPSQYYHRDSISHRSHNRSGK